MMFKRLIGLVLGLGMTAALAAGPNTTTSPLNLLNSEGSAGANYLVCSNATAGLAPSWCSVASRLVQGTGITLSGTTQVTISATAGAPGGSTNDIQYNAGSSTLGGITLTNGQLVVGQTSATPLAKTLSGDCTLAASGAITCSQLGGAFFTVSGPASSVKTFTFPNASATVLTTNATVTVAQGGTGAMSLSSGKPLFGAGTSAITTGTLTGSTTVLATSTGALANGDCVSIDASGNFVDAGGPCTTGGGGGTVTSALINQLAYYAAAGTTVSGLATANNGALITNGSGVPSIGAVPLANIATIGANTALINNTSGSHIPVAASLPSCSSSTSALIYTTSTNFGCNVFGTVVTQNTGTSGANVPLLNANNTYSGSANFTGTFQIGTQTMTFPASADTLAGLGTVEIWTAAQTYTNSKLLLLGSSTGVTTFTSANAGASNYTLTIPAATDTVAELGATQTFTGVNTFSGHVLATGLATSGTISGSMCQDSSGNVIANASTNCFGGSNAPTLLATLDATGGVASLSDTTHLTSSYKSYQLVFQNIAPATNTVALEIQFSNNAGSSWASSGYLNQASVTTYSPVINGVNSVEISFKTGQIIGIAGTFSLTGIASSNGVALSGLGVCASTTITSCQLGSTNSTVGVVNGIKFFFSSGNIASGKIEIWGIP